MKLIVWENALPGSFPTKNKRKQTIVLNYEYLTIISMMMRRTDGL